MSRRTRAERREIVPDARFDSELVTRFVNTLMLDGKKSLAERIFYDAVDILEERSGQPGLNTFLQAVTNAKPALEVKRYRARHCFFRSRRGLPRTIARVRPG